MELLVTERYLLCKKLNTSYIDTGRISIIEKNQLLKLIEKENEIISKKNKEK